MKVAVARLAVSGWERVEVGNWLLEVASTNVGCDVVHYCVSKVPTNCARNSAVEIARKHKADILVMVDDDMSPSEGFYGLAVNFLKEKAAIIASPYCLTGPEEQVNVFEWAAPQNRAQPDFRLSHIGRTDAAKRTGIEEVANFGTGFCAINMQVFDKLEKPYFDYTYNEDCTVAIETEDCAFGRKCWVANIPIYVSWDHWSNHIKEVSIKKPILLSRQQIESLISRQVT